MRKAKKTETIELSNDESDTSGKEVQKKSNGKEKATQKEAKQRMIAWVWLIMGRMTPKRCPVSGAGPRKPVTRSIRGKFRMPADCTGLFALPASPAVRQATSPYILTSFSIGPINRGLILLSIQSKFWDQFGTSISIYRFGANFDRSKIRALLRTNFVLTSPIARCWSGWSGGPAAARYVITRAKFRGRKEGSIYTA
jgi:hypothetical protein